MYNFTFIVNKPCKRVFLISNKLHLAVQRTIAQILKGEEIFLEYRCKNHIVDVFWKRYRIAFEVQCSNMTLKECKRRTKDLEKQGLLVVWILHQKTFNKKYVSPMELYVRKKKKAYYTNISQDQNGIIFDQEEAFHFWNRTTKSVPLPIDITKPFTFFSKISFQGDLSHLGIKRRIFLFPSIWKEKWKKTRAHFLQKYRYWKIYFLWKIKI